MDVARQMVKSISARAAAVKTGAVPAVTPLSLEFADTVPAKITLSAETAARVCIPSGQPAYPSPFVVFADYQSKGRGTNGRDWAMEASSNLAMTLVVPADSVPMALLPVLPLIVGISARASIVGAAGRMGEGGSGAVALAAFRLKWPNDVLCAKKKVMGVLIEHEGDSLMIGIGVNVGSAPRVDTSTGAREATSLREHFGWARPSAFFGAGNASAFADAGGVLLGADDVGPEAWAALAVGIGHEVCHEIVARLAAAAEDKNARRMADADVRRAVIADFTRFMETAIVLRKRGDEGAPGRGDEVAPIALNDWGHLRVRHLASGREETLAAEYLN